MKPDSLSIKSYTEIRKLILSTQLVAGTRLKEDEWAKKIGVSRMAVREALNRLLGEGLVTFGEKGGYFVSAITVENVRQIKELREILEIGALRLLINKITDENLNELQQICDDYTMMLKQGYISGACEADIKFHETLIKSAQNDRLFNIYIASHIPLFHQKLGKSQTSLDDYQQTDTEHRALVAAIKNKNLKLAEDTLKSHFQRGELLMLSL